MAELERGPHETLVARTTITGVDGVEVPAIHAAPTDGAAAAGVVLHPDIMGIRPLFDDLCERVASHGYAVACPEPFARATPEARATEDVAVRMRAVAALDDDLQLGDLTRAADLLADADGITTAHVLGFCMGGMQTLKAAATGRFAPPPITIVQSIDLYRLLAVADAHLGIHSTLLTEAVATGTPNLLAAGLASADLLGYVDAGVAVPVRNGADLLAALDRPRAEIMRDEDRRAFLRAHFEPGDASGRIADDLLAWLE